MNLLPECTMDPRATIMKFNFNGKHLLDCIPKLPLRYGKSQISYTIYMKDLAIMNIFICNHCFGTVSRYGSLHLKASFNLRASTTNRKSRLLFEMISLAPVERVSSESINFNPRLLNEAECEQDVCKIYVFNIK